MASDRPAYVDSLAAFVRGRPKQPLDAFMRRSEAVRTHDAAAQLARITAPTLVTVGRWDLATSIRSVPALETIPDVEVHVPEDCAQAAYENVPAFSERTLAFLRAHHRVAARDGRGAA